MTYYWNLPEKEQNKFIKLYEKAEELTNEIIYSNSKFTMQRRISGGDGSVAFYGDIETGDMFWIKISYFTPKFFIKVESIPEIKIELKSTFGFDLTNKQKQTLKTINTKLVKLFNNINQAHFTKLES